MDLKIIRFVSLAQTDRFTISDLCAQFNISRKTGHMWVVCFRRRARRASNKRAAAGPHDCVHQTALRIVQLILRRRQHRTLEPKRLRNRG